MKKMKKPLYKRKQLCYNRNESKGKQTHFNQEERFNGL